MLAAEEINAPSIVARAHNLLGLIDRSRAKTQDAAAHFEEALALYREMKISGPGTSTELARQCLL